MTSAPRRPVLDPDGFNARPSALDPENRMDLPALTIVEKIQSSLDVLKFLAPQEVIPFQKRFDLSKEHRSIEGYKSVYGDLERRIARLLRAGA